MTIAMESINESKIDMFFEQLADYYWHENDLSNVTVALCNSSECFKEIFLKFFFESIDVNDVNRITREVCDSNGAGSRVDIHISTNFGKLYIIEVKIYDSNHHPEYLSNYDVDCSHFGYITNYRCNKDFSATFRTWGEFYDCLANNYDVLDNLSRAYMNYLKTVCNIKRYTTPMNFSGINSICQLLDTTNQIIENCANSFTEMKLVAYNITDVQKSPLVIARRYGICTASGEWLLNGYIYVDVERATLGYSANGEIDVMEKLRSFMLGDSRCWGYPSIELSSAQMNQLNNLDIVGQKDISER